MLKNSYLRIRISRHEKKFIHPRGMNKNVKNEQSQKIVTVISVPMNFKNNGRLERSKKLRVFTARKR